MRLDWHAYVDGKRATPLDLHVWVGRDTRDEALVRSIRFELEMLVKHDLLDVLRTVLLAEKAAAAQAEEDARTAAQAEPKLDAEKTIVPDRVDWHAETQEPRS